MRPTPSRSWQGELQLAILIEMMRREGYELSVSQPETVTKVVDGRTHEPMENLVIDCPRSSSAWSPRSSAPARAHDQDGEQRTRPGPARVPHPRAGPHRLPLRVPDGYARHRPPEPPLRRVRALAGPIAKRSTGALVADRAGKTTTYALYHIQPRGELFIGESTAVYEGMIVGRTRARPIWM